MKKVLFIGLLCICFGCTHKPKQPERLPDAETHEFREACLKLSPYVVLNDSAYHLEISKEAAFELGVPQKYYDRMQQELEYTNYVVREEYNKKGIPIEMPEYQIDSIN